MSGECHSMLLLLLDLYVYVFAIPDRFLFHVTFTVMFVVGSNP